MPKHIFDSTESHTQLSLAKKTKTNNKQSQTELNSLPNEILAKIFEYLSASDIEKARRVSTWFNQVITTQYHGPRSSGLNNYLNLFYDNKENTALTYYDYFEKIKKYKEPFLEKQFSEIKVIQKNLIFGLWCNVSPKLKKEILEIKEKSANYIEANEREALLNEINAEIIKSEISLQSESLRLKNLNLTRLPKALFTDNELQEFWQALRYLSLDNNQLTSLPPQIGELSKLGHLLLNNNQLTSLPPEICELRELECLSLRNNPLTSETRGQLRQRFGVNFLQGILETQTYPNIAQTERLGLENLRELSLNLNQFTPTSGILGQLRQPFDANFLQGILETQTDPNTAQAEEPSNRNSLRPQ